jgi:hypothetical protein
VADHAHAGALEVGLHAVLELVSKATMLARAASARATSPCVTGPTEPPTISRRTLVDLISCRQPCEGFERAVDVGLEQDAEDLLLVLGEGGHEALEVGHARAGAGVRGLPLGLGGLAGGERGLFGELAGFAVVLDHAELGAGARDGVPAEDESGRARGGLRQAVAAVIHDARTLHQVSPQTSDVAGA